MEEDEFEEENDLEHYPPPSKMTYEEMVAFRSEADSRDFYYRIAQDGTQYRYNMEDGKVITKILSPDDPDWRDPVTLSRNPRGVK